MCKPNKYFQVFIIIILVSYAVSARGAETLYVFYPSVLTAASVQKKLSEACKGIEIMVFGRFKDFEEGVVKDMPDAILTKPPVIEQIKAYAVRLNGVRGGSAEESYVFLSVNLSVDKGGDLSSLSNMQIGIFDILGRKQTEAFAGKFLNPVPKLRRVSKMEDLLQMLTFNMADGILIPEIFVSHYKEISKLNFAVTPVPNMKTGILALGVRQGQEAPLIIKTLTSLDKQYMELLQVEQWK
jgi:hypothetical protein